MFKPLSFLLDAALQPYEAAGSLLWTGLGGRREQAAMCRSSQTLCATHSERLHVAVQYIHEP